MAEDKEIVCAGDILVEPLQRSSPFLEILCRNSGKVRRFSVGTEARFALQLINQKLRSGVPLASYIEAVKPGEESVSFGPSSVLVDYGDGWKLQAVTNAGFDQENVVEERSLNRLPDEIESAGDDVQSTINPELHFIDPLQQEENRRRASKPVSDIESQSFKELDFTNTFTTDVVFNSRDELIKWTRDVGRSVGNVIVIKKSEFGGKGRTSRILFACERGGKYNKRESMNKTSTRQRVSRTCGCPFLLRGVKLPKDDQWKVKVECGRHNHPLERHLQGSSAAGKLTPEEKKLVMEMSRAGIRPKEILKVLKERDPRNESTIHRIYNIQAKLRRDISQIIEMPATSQSNSS